MTPQPPSSLLVIRRDNIGDLICTTPLIAALRLHFPQAWIGALVNEYASQVLDRNPDLDVVYSYRKAKHRIAGETVLGIYWKRLLLLQTLRRRHIDCVILASPGHQASAERIARWIRPRSLIGFGDRQGRGTYGIRLPQSTERMMHQVENTYRALQPLGIVGPPPPMKLIPDPQKVTDLRIMLGACRQPIVGVHISAREADRRWPDGHFARLIHALIHDRRVSVVLTWAPGAKDRVDFPGDDESASRLKERCVGTGLHAIRTHTLSDLINCLAVCDVVICSDGGPVHIAAALGKSVVALFGSERPELWHPWGVPYRLLQSERRNVADISVDEVMQAFIDLVSAG